MKRVVRVSFLAAGVLAAMLGFAPAAGAATIDVLPGQSIQAAVNRASPGDTIVVHPGIYQESVVVTKDHLTLHGAGASGAGTVLMPPRTSNRCLHGGAGICVFGQQGAARIDTTVEGFEFKGFGAFGLVGFGARNLTVRHNYAVDNGEYGITCFDCSGLRYLYNKVTGSDEAGFYIGDTPNADATVIGNEAWGNFFGFFLRDSNVGKLEGNKAHDNCMGIALLNTGAPSDVHGWKILDNDANQNTRACPGGGDAPPISGVGIGVLGASHNTVAHNTVWGNHPTGDTVLSGGIVLFDTTKSDHGSTPNGNAIRRNVLYRNKAFDINDDQSGHGNAFVGNKCHSSNPAGLCH